MAGPQRRRGREESRPRRVMPWGDVPRADMTAEDGVILIDKPRGVTSHDVVGAIRRLAGTRKVGHAGTLDPMATGLLIVGIGRATKLLTYVSGADKDYHASVAFGLETTTEDADGEPIVPDPSELLRRNALMTDGSFAALIDAAMVELTGEILQVPSSVSALKIAGKRAHELVRAGQTVELAARPVRIAEFQRKSELTPHTLDGAEQEIPLMIMAAFASVSSGTYVRALTRDLGIACCEVGAHLRELRRTRIGTFDIADATRIEHLSERVRRAEPIGVVPLARAARGILPSIEITEREATALSFGQFIERPNPFPASWPAAAFAPDGRVVAIVSRRSGQLKPDVLLHADAEACHPED